MANILTLDNIKKSYGNKNPIEVLHGISLSIEEGSFNSIIGQSGSGKSTLLNILGTLDLPTSGYLEIAGKETSKMNRKELAKLRNETMGFIFQFHHLLPEFSALENVLMPYKIQNGSVTKAAKEKALNLMKLVDLEHVVYNKATEMSGGQQQRTAIARALMNDPKIILADEPTGNLDSDTTEKIYELMRKINKELNTTFLIVTHDEKVAEKTDRIIEMKDGNIVLDISTV